MQALSLSSVSKSFGEVRAISNISFDVEEGEFFCILGPSGAGKTTTLRTIAGLVQPDAGDVRIRERSMARVHPRDRHVGFFFQEVALYPHLTAFENIAFPLRQQHQSPADVRRRVSEIAETLHVSHLLDRRPATFSGGERQRVALSRVLVRRSGVYLLDEPLSNLDAKLRAEARVELKRLQREFGLTTVYVTPDQSEAMAMADRILVLNHGEILQVGSPIEVYERPVDRFVATFIGSPAMNLVPCSLRRDGSHWTLSHAGFRAVVELRDIEQHGLPAEVLLGIRPGDIHVMQSPEGSFVEVEVTVAAAEHLGHRSLIDVQIRGEGANLQAFAPGFSKLQSGQRSTVFLDIAQSQLIDPRTEKVLARGDAIRSFIS